MTGARQPTGICKLDYKIFVTKISAKIKGGEF